MNTSTVAMGNGMRLLLLGAVTGLALAGTPRAQERSISDLQWLAGVWRSEDRAVTIEERWTPPAGGAMLAVSRTVKGDRMAAFEFLRIVQRGGTLVYIAQPGGRPPTEFTATRQSPRSITFENPKHDFPKMIEYTLRQDGRLEARVSDGAKTEERFVFDSIQR